ETHEMVEAYLKGDLVYARKLQLGYLAMINALFLEVNPIPVKAAMNLMGMNVGGYRLPLYPMSDENCHKLAETMKECGLI
ncbi:MAG: dihydrodipicolinate synthase family protein, partial [Clostridiaceae bacterium]|nr:dihydrodipicolinate synthase family protein [Clostridiaceae bacterium]